MHRKVGAGFLRARRCIGRTAPTGGVAVAAAEAGAARTHLSLTLPVSAAQAGEAYLAALDEGAGGLVRFVHPGFAIVKLLAFVSLQGILAFLLVGLALFLRSGRRSRADFQVEGARFKSGSDLEP